MQRRLLRGKQQGLVRDRPALLALGAVVIRVLGPRVTGKTLEQVFADEAADAHTSAAAVVPSLELRVEDGVA